MEADIIVVQEAFRQRENDVDYLRKERTDLELQITALESQITRLGAECSVIKDERDKDENEVDKLRREKAELERDVFSLQSQQRHLETNISVGDEAWRKKAIATNGLQTNVQDITNNLETLARRKEDLQAEIIKIKATRDQEEREMQQLRREKSEIEVQLSVLRADSNEQEQEYRPEHGTHDKEGYLGSRTNDVPTTQVRNINGACISCLPFCLFKFQFVTSGMGIWRYFINYYGLTMQCFWMLLIRQI